MHARAVANEPTSMIAEARPVPDPMRSYQAYLGAIARRDFAAVIAAMTQACAQRLLGLREFGSLFDLWCENQRDPVIVTRYSVQHHRTIIDVRTRHTVGRVTLHLFDGVWRVDSEFHQPLCSRDAAAQHKKMS